MSCLEKEAQSSLTTGCLPQFMVDSYSTKDFHLSIRVYLVPGQGWMKGSLLLSHRLNVLWGCQLLPCLSHGSAVASARAGGRYDFWGGTRARQLRTSTTLYPHACSIVPWTLLIKHKCKDKIKNFKPTLPAEQ